MKPIHRSLSGLALAVVSIPVFVGLLACIPTMPMIGDPEKSRIDPDLNGLWVDLDEEAVVFFEPYDKRSWLVTYAGFDASGETCAAPAGTGDEAAGFDSYEQLIARAADDDTCFQFDDEILVFKAWRTEIAGQAFMTWEQKGVFVGEYGLGPYTWFSFRALQPGSDRLVLQIIDFESDKFQEDELLEEFTDADPPLDPQMVDKARRAAERIIRRNIDDETLYGEDDGLELRRIDSDHWHLFEDVFDEAMGGV